MKHGTHWTCFRTDREPWRTPLWQIDFADLEAADLARELGRDPDGPYLHLVLHANSGVPCLKRAVLEELEGVLGDIASERGVEAMLLWSDDREHFIAGADIDEIYEIQLAESAAALIAEAHRIFGKLASLPFPTFAAIRGTCLGGGLELALACDYRIAIDTPTTRIGLPEINLGIFPGFGGSQRLPRLIGLRSALALILAATRLPANAAMRRGVVDIVVPAAGYVDLVHRAVASVLRDPARIAKARRKRHSGIIHRALERTPFGRRLIHKRAKQQIESKTGGHYPAPLAALDAIVLGFGESLDAGLAREARLCGPLVASSESKNLIAIFKDSEVARKQAEPGDVDDGTPAVTSPALVAVIGAGVMGAGVARALIERDHRVRLRDLDIAAISRALAQIGNALDRKLRRRRLTVRERDAITSRLTFTIAMDGFRHASACIEAVIEKLDMKRAVLADFERVLPKDAMFATNTSALAITDIQRGARHPERVVGLHFFNPVDRMPLVEVIPGGETSVETVRSAIRLATTLGKYPIVVKDSPGFLVNRLLMPYLDSACRLLEQGIPGERIDRVACDFGLPMGPFRLLDEVGLDIAVEVAETLHGAFGDRSAPSKVLELLRDRELVGKKGGAGFYTYPLDGSNEWNPALRSVFPAASTLPEDSAICDFLIDRLIDEATRCLDEGVVASPAELDLAMVMGTGFPPFRGGPLRYADAESLPAIVERLQERESQGLPGAPCALLIELARSGQGLHSLPERSLLAKQS